MSLSDLNIVPIKMDWQEAKENLFDADYKILHVHSLIEKIHSKEFFEPQVQLLTYMSIADMELSEKKQVIRYNEIVGNI